MDIYTLVYGISLKENLVIPTNKQNFNCNKKNKVKVESSNTEKIEQLSALNFKLQVENEALIEK